MQRVKGIHTGVYTGTVPMVSKISDQADRLVEIRPWLYEAGKICGQHCESKEI